MIRWHDGDLGSSRDAVTAVAAVAVRAFLLGMVLGFARGLLVQREPRRTRPAAPTAGAVATPAVPRDLRPWDDTPVEDRLDLEPVTVGRT